MADRRRLAAIVAADVAGFSRLMGIDESGTLAALKAHRVQFVDPAVVAHGGRIVNTAGDGLLLEFPSVVDATRCAAEIQEGMVERNAGVPPEQRLTFRIGIHVGDVIVEGDDIFGDGVNVAARLQALAAPGGICVSQRTYDDVRDRLPVGFADGGEHALKNIARPIRVWHWTGAAPASLPGTTAPAFPDRPSIAVLPLVNMSDDAANEYFADGLSEELINVLAKIRGLRVASRTSAFSFKGAKVDIPTVAQKLNVATILEGSVRKAGSRVRITAQLVNVATDSHLWSETYDRELEDIFAVQDDIAHAVVNEMRTALMGEHEPSPDSAEVAAEVQAAVKGRSSNAEAYRLYLEGSFFLNRYNDEDTKKAIDCFRRALNVDPGYAKAWASLSFCYLQQEVHAWAPIAEGAERAREAARHALGVGPDVAASHWALAAVLVWYDWDWRGAEASIRRALQLAPEDSQLLIHAARLMHNLGQLDEAAALVRQALALDPLNVEAHMTSGMQLLYTERLAEAEHAFRKAVELSHHQRARVHYLLGRVHIAQGRLDDALREIKLEAHETFRLLGSVLVQRARGRMAESTAAMRELTRKHAQGAAYQIAQAHAYQGEADLAFEWLERAHRQRDAGLASMKVDPLLRELHADPRWQPWLERMRLAD